MTDVMEEVGARIHLPTGASRPLERLVVRTGPVARGPYNAGPPSS